MIGQILSNKEVSLSRIQMEGTAEISQVLATTGGENRFYTQRSDRGLCEVTSPVSLEGIELRNLAARGRWGRGRALKVG